jgi:prepilin-type N-terminal cleavage/methylation domain-containing protein
LGAYLRHGTLVYLERRVTLPDHSSASEKRIPASGFTLVELMVVLTIVGALVAVAIPVFTRDTSHADFDNFVRHLAQDVTRARLGAMAQREEHGINIPADGKSYELVSVFTDSGGTTETLLRKVQTPSTVQIVGGATVATTPGLGYSLFAWDPDSPTNLPLQVRFAPIGDVTRALGGSAFGAGGASIYIASVVNGEVRYRARIVIYKSTGYSRVYDSW